MVDRDEEADACRDGYRAGECRDGPQEAGRQTESPSGRDAVTDGAGIQAGIPHVSAHRPQLRCEREYGISYNPLVSGSTDQERCLHAAGQEGPAQTRARRQGHPDRCDGNTRRAPSNKQRRYYSGKKNCHILRKNATPSRQNSSSTRPRIRFSVLPTMWAAIMTAGCSKNPGSGCIPRPKPPPPPGIWVCKS